MFHTYISNININNTNINKLSIKNNNTNINKLSINNNNNTNKLSTNKYISIVKKFRVIDISSLDEVDFEEAVDELKLLN